MSHTRMAMNEKTALQTGTAAPADVEVRSGLEFERYFTDGRTPPFDAVGARRAATSPILPRATPSATN